MEQKELEKYMMEQFLDTSDKSDGDIIGSVISAVAAGIVKAQEMDEKNLADKVYKSLQHKSMIRGHL